jgi:hypothetical protein
MILVGWIAGTASRLRRSRLSNFDRRLDEPYRLDCRHCLLLTAVPHIEFRLQVWMRLLGWIAGIASRFKAVPLIELRLQVG